MIHSIYQVKNQQKTKFSNPLSSFTSQPHLPVYLDFSPHTFFGVLWTSLPDHHWPKSALYCSIRRQHSSVGTPPLLRKPIPGLFT